MRLSLAILAAAALVAAAPARAAEEDAILGLWATEPDEHGFARVEIARAGEAFEGRIVWLSEPNVPADDPEGRAGQPKTDHRNPDPALRERPVLGLRIAEGFRYAGNGQWKQGQIYDPASGNRYHCNLKLLPDGRLRVRGYVGISLLGRSTTWTRTAPAD